MRTLQALGLTAVAAAILLGALVDTGGFDGRAWMVFQLGLGITSLGTAGRCLGVEERRND